MFLEPVHELLLVNILFSTWGEHLSDHYTYSCFAYRVPEGMNSVNRNELTDYLA